jgi:hypothetical protein
VQFGLGAVGQPPAQHVLLQHAVVGGVPPDDVVVQAGYRPDRARQRLQVLLDRLLEQVVVVPDDRVRGVDLADRVDVAGFQRGKEADNEFLADGSALLDYRNASRCPFGSVVPAVLLLMAAMVCS